MPQRSKKPRFKKPPPTANLPATLLETEAKAFARRWITRVNQDKGLWDSPYATFDPATSDWLIKMYVKDLVEASQPLQVAVVVEAAVHGCRHSNAALIEVIAEKTNRNEPLGTVLGGYAIRALNPDIPRDRGKSRWSNVIQNVFIGLLILALIQRFPPMRATRSQIGRKLQPSACSIVGDVLAELGLHRGNEGAIEKIWGWFNPNVHKEMRWDVHPQIISWGENP